MTTLMIFFGLPGAGKSSLAGRLAHEWRWPFLPLDRPLKTGSYHG